MRNQRLKQILDWTQLVPELESPVEFESPATVNPKLEDLERVFGEEARTIIGFEVEDRAEI